MFYLASSCMANICSAQLSYVFKFYNVLCQILCDCVESLFAFHLKVMYLVKQKLTKLMVVKPNPFKNCPYQGCGFKAKNAYHLDAHAKRCPRKESKRFKDKNVPKYLQELCKKVDGHHVCPLGCDFKTQDQSELNQHITQSHADSDPMQNARKLTEHYLRVNPNHPDQAAYRKYTKKLFSVPNTKGKKFVFELVTLRLPMIL